VSSRVPVTLSADEKAEVRRRAAAHGISMSAYMRTAALATYGAPEDDVEVIWSSLPQSRKEGVIRWLYGLRRKEVPDGQASLLEDLDGQPLP